MFCPKCGHQNAEGSAFCRNCGAPLSTANARPGSQQTTAYSAYQQGAYAQPVKNPVGLAVLKKACSSPAALVAVIAYTVAAFFSLISSLSEGLSAYMFQFASWLDVDEYGEELYHVVHSTSVVSILMIGMIPTILLTVGLWMTYSSASNRQNPGIKMSGLTMIKVILIIELVFTCIALSAFEFIALIMGIAIFADSSFDPFAVATVVIVMLFCAIVVALTILFYIKAIKSVDTISMTARTGNPSDNVSSYVAVMCFVIGGFAALSIFRNYTNIFAVLANLCSATAFIALGVFLFSYRDQMRAVMFGGGYANMTQQQTFADPTWFAYDSPTQTASGRPNASDSQNVRTDQPTTAPTDAPQQDAVQQDAPQQNEPRQDEPQQLITCPNCGKQFKIMQGQTFQCPYCGHQDNQDNQ